MEGIVVIVLSLTLFAGLLTLDAPATAAEKVASGTTDDLVCIPGITVELPPADTTGGMPLMKALSLRRSSREYKPTAIPMQTLSTLLWAANGVNRKAEGLHTAATARNWQNLDVWVITAKGQFRYDPEKHALVPVKAGDFRAVTGRQPFVGEAPLNLVYVSDSTKATVTDDPMRLVSYDGIHAGIVSQNVSLFAASAGLGTVVRAAFDRVALESALGLPSTQRAILAQTVGYTK